MTDKIKQEKHFPFLGNRETDVLRFLTEVEKVQIGKDLSALVILVEDERSMLMDHAKEAKNRIQEKEEEISYLSRNLTKGTVLETKTLPCYLDSNEKFYRDSETGKEVKREPATPDDKQIVMSVHPGAVLKGLRVAKEAKRTDEEQAKQEKQEDGNLGGEKR